MDTSKEYIEMCEKAEEIQPHDDWEDGDFFYHELKVQESAGYGGGVFVECDQEYTLHEAYRSKGDRHKNKRWVWLPRQDQLQEIVRGSKHLHLLAYEFAAYFHGSIDPLYPEIGRDNFTVDSDNSMEQMWLAFVMKVKYSKIWDGEEWVK